MRRVREVIGKANIAKEDIDEIILVGGSSRIPKIRAMLEDYFDGKVIHDSIDAEESVAYGAAVYAADVMKSN